jgi:aspartate/methionine/tyrosine aminotransferase
LTTYQNLRHHSIAKYYPEGTLVIGGPSKDRSLGGYRLGVLLLPKSELQVLNAIIGIGSEIWSCVSVPLQYAAIEAYATDKEIVNYIQRCTMIHEIVTGYAYNLIQNANIDCPPPQGAFYLFPNWNRHRVPLKQKGISTSEDLSKHLLRNWKVASLPGSHFGMPHSSLSLRLAAVDYDGKNAIDRFQEEGKAVPSNTDMLVAEIAPRVVKACNQLVEFSNQLLMPVARRVKTV